ncbi:MAG: hypothetical protein R3Y40_03500 [Eubacteriales bacterium]
MKKTKRILAIIGIILLVALYLITLIFAFIDTTTSLVFFKTAIGATIFFPVMLYIMTVAYRLTGGNSRFQDDDDSSDNSPNEDF